MTVASDAKACIVPVGVGMQDDFKRKGASQEGKMTMELMYKTAQHMNTLIFQRNENYLQINPDWFPQIPMARTRQACT